MNSSIKKLSLTLLCAFLALCAFFTLMNGVTVNAVKADAAVVNETTYDFTMEDGIQAKIASFENGATNAIRFVTKLDGDVDLSGKKVVTLITLAENLENAGIADDNFKLENLADIKYSAVVFSDANGNVPEVDSDGYYYFNACIYNVKDANYTKKFAARSYITDENGLVTQYTSFDISKNAAALWDVADYWKDLVEDQSACGPNADLTASAYLATLCKTYDVTLNEESATITLKHGEYLTTDDIKSQVNVEGDTYFDGSIEGIDVTKPVTASAAVTVGVGKLEYLPVDASGAEVTDATTAAGYKVTKGTLTNVAAGTTIKIPATYNDLPVLKIGKFNNLTDLKKFIATDTTTLIGTEAFWSCSNLEFVSIPGVTSLTEGNEFHRCASLKTLVVGSGFKQNIAQSFNNGSGTKEGAIIDVYTMGAVSSVSLITGLDQNKYKNGLLTGNVYSYDERGICNTWKFNADGDGVVLNENTEHTYGADGKCINCNLIDTKGINYIWDDTAQAYYVTANTAYDVNEYGTVLNVLSEYDDLIHGEAAVVGVKGSSFNSRSSTSYAGVTHVILPESVTIIESDAFWNATTVNYISMLGVSKLSGENNFLNATALEQVVIKKSLSYSNQAFVVTSSYSSGYTSKVDIFVMEQGGQIKQHSNDNMRTGDVYSYDSQLTCGMTWKYDTDGYTIIKATSNNHNFVNGICETCSKDETYDNGINFVYVEDAGYYVVGNRYYNVDKYGTKLIVPSEYDDGTNGKHSVVGVKAYAFSTDATVNHYVGVTHVILPTSVTIIEGSAFWKTTAEYVSMIGVTQITATNASNNQFLNCPNLKTLVVNENLKVTGQVFATMNKGIDLYVYGSDTSKVTTGNNATALSGNRYSYSETQPEENLLATTWRYDDAGYAILWSEYLASQA